MNQALSLQNGRTALSDMTFRPPSPTPRDRTWRSGTATLQALGDTDGLVVLNLSGGQQQGIWNGQSGAWVGTGGTLNYL